jgi:phosphoribosylformylglycinamidine cyclo-ligase
VVAGIATGCEQSGCALIGGETAEMPDSYPDGEYDLAGFAVGVVEKSKIIDGRSIVPGDVVIGLHSSGAHSNGYSLVRRVIERAHGGVGLPAMQAGFEGGTFADAVMAPTRLYVKPVLALLAAVPVKGMAHITGGGLVENVPRVLPERCQAVLHRDAWRRPAIFDWLQREGRIADDEMHRVFNCGIGMAIVVAASDAEAALATLAAAGESPRRIGEIVERPGQAAQTVVL